jgi:hypothetical protein
MALAPFDIHHGSDAAAIVLKRRVVHTSLAFPGWVYDVFLHMLFLSLSFLNDFYLIDI